MHELRVLGALDLRGTDGSEVLSVLAQPKRVCFLTYLALKHPEPSCDRDELQDLFWPNLSPDRARAAVRKSLHFLRQSLGEETIQSPVQEEVALDRERLWCDAAAFRDAAAGGEEEEALALYQGDLLDGVSLPECPGFEEWVLAERERLREVAAAAAWGLAARHVREGRIGEAERAGHRALELARTEEGPLLAFLRSMADAGDPGAAVRFFGRFAQGLKRETGADPSAAAQALVEEIRAAAEPVLPVASPPSDIAGLRSTSPAIPSPDRLAPPAPSPIPMGTRSVAAVGWVAAAAFAIMAGWTFRALLEREPPTPLQWPLMLGESVIPTSWKAPPGVEFALSPDGSKLAYVGPTDEGWQLWYLDLEDEEDEPRTLPLPHSAYNPVFSPEGDFLAYETDGGIYTVSVSGEARSPVPSVRTSSDRTAAEPAGIQLMPAWGDDDWIYFALDGIIRRIPASGGGVTSAPESQAFTDSTEHGRHFHPSALPDGRGLLVTIARDPAELSTIGVAGRRGGEVDDLQVKGAMARYATSGHLVYTTLDGVLWAVPFDLGDLEVKGDPRRMAAPVDVKANLASQFTLSRAGHLAYRTGPFLPVDPSLVRVNQGGSMEPVDSSWLGRFEFLELSPRQTHLAVTVEGPGGSRHIWVKEMAGGPPVQLTRGPSQNEDPEWSSDGQWITFLSNRLGEGDVWRVRADGVGEAELVYDGPRGIDNHAWSPDDEWLVYTHDSPELDDGIRAVRPGTNLAAQAVVVTEGREDNPNVSPDGRWIAWAGPDEAGENCVHVARFPDPGPESWSWPSTRAGVPVWSHDGRRLFFWRTTDPSDRRSSAELVAIELDFELGLFQEHPVPALQGISLENVDISYDVMDGDSTFLMVRIGGLNGQLILWQNFTEELKELGSG